MGFLGRMTSALGSLGEATTTPFTFVMDIAFSPMNDDETKDFSDKVAASAKANANKLVQGTIGPESVSGVLIDKAPQPVKNVGNDVMDGLEWAYRNAISRPLSTVQTAANLSDNRSYSEEDTDGSFIGGAKNFIKKDTWSDAWAMSRDISPGQAFARNALEINSEDPAEVQKYAGTPIYDAVSTPIDALLRIFADPTIVAGKAGAAVRASETLTGAAIKGETIGEAAKATTGAKTIVDDIEAATPNDGTLAPGQKVRAKKKISTQEDINRVVSSTKYEEFSADVDKLSVGEVEQKYFAGLDQGALLAGLLKDAPRGEDRRLVMRTLLGDKEALTGLAERKADLAPKVARLYQEDMVIRGLQDAPPGEQLSLLEDMSGIKAAEPAPIMLGDDVVMAGRDMTRNAEFPEVINPNNSNNWLDAHFAIQNNDARRAEVLSEINASIPEYQLVNNRIDAWATLQKLPNADGLDVKVGQFRLNVTRSETFQNSLLGRAVKTVYTNKPHRIVNVHDDQSYQQVQRMFQEAGVDAPKTDEWVQRYAKTSPDGRSLVLLEAEEAVMRHILGDLDEETFTKILQARNRGHAQAKQVLAKRKYDGEGRSRLSYSDNDQDMDIDLPLMVSQNANVMPIVDVVELKRAAASMKEITTRYSGENLQKKVAEFTDSKLFTIPEDVLNKYYRLWKPATLFRLGWPIRQGVDSQFRIISQLGGLTASKNLLNAGREGLDAARRQVQNSGSLYGPLSKEIRNLDAYKPNQKNLNVGGYVFPGMFGSPADDADVVRSLVSSSINNKSVSGTLEDDLLRQMRDPQNIDDVTLPSGRQVTGNWITINPAKEAEFPGDYKVAWEWVVNNQLGQDKMARQLLMGKSDKEVVDWMLKDPEGFDHLLKMDSRRREDIGKWVEDLRGQVESYTLNNPAIKEAVLNNKATSDLLETVLPDRAQWPVIHGPELQQAQRKGPVMDAITRFTNAGYHWLGTIPEDVFARHPYSGAVYEAEVKRLVALTDDSKGLGPEDIDRITKRARAYSLQSTRKLFMDMREQSQFASMLRFISPYYSAWQDVVTRWTGIAIKNPAVPAYLAQVWQSPEKAGLIQDENGMEITADGRALDPQTGLPITDPNTGKPFKPGKDRYITIPIPKGLVDEDTGLGKFLSNQGSYRINKKSLNLLATLNPGVGPPVQLSVNEIVKRNPGAEDAMKTLGILPFGAQSTESILIPGTPRRMTQGEDDKTFLNMSNRILQTMYWNYKVSLSGPNPLPPPNIDDAIEQARIHKSIQITAGLTLPATGSFVSPYQPYIDTYRRVNNSFGEITAKDPTASPLGRNSDGSKKTPEDWFIDNYGDEMAIFTQSLTKSNDGVPPTVEALRAREEHKDLIEEYADLGLGGLIIGSEGAGEFANSVYQRQLSESVSPGSKENQRDSKSNDEFATDLQTGPAYKTYRKAMDLIDAERNNRGLTSLNTKAGADLKAAKAMVIEKLAAAYPLWYEEFQKTDRGVADRKIKALEAIASDPKMQQRDEIKVLGQYLQGRKLFVDELTSRKAQGGSATLEQNPDLAEAWERYNNMLIDSSLPYSDTYYRYLSTDKLSAE